jgi:hypothetical protein
MLEIMPHSRDPSRKKRAQDDGLPKTNRSTSSKEQRTSS